MPKINMQLHEVRSACEGLSELSGIRMGVRGSYWVSKLLNIMNREAKVIEEQRVDLIKKYGDPMPDNPEVFQVLPDSKNGAEFYKELNVLMSTEDDFEVPLLTLDMLDGVEVMPSTLAKLDKLLVESLPM